jgi:capsular polysaccharide transport system permease protein
VQAFRPEDALLITQTLLELGEEMVNRLNERINADAIRTAAEEVGRSEQRMIDAQMALTEFRNRELMVDAVQSSVVITEVIAGLDAERIAAQAQISQLAAAAPDNPQIKLLYGKVNALNGQISDQRALIAEPSTGIAKKLAEFERLSLMREFAKMSLSSANTALDNARTEARRQQLYLERVVEPNLPDFPISPQRLRMIATIIGGNALFLLVIWLFYMGVREHGAGAG